MGGQQARVIWGGPACQASACAQVQVPCPQPPSRILGHRLRSKALKPQKPGGGVSQPHSDRALGLWG